MKKPALLLLCSLLLLTGCAAGAETAATPPPRGHYQQIDQETAKEMMALDDDHLIVDVRRYDEFESGHIPGAICIPNESIETDMPEELPNRAQILLIYCRSGRRSKEAAEKLVDMGYANVYEFGGHRLDGRGRDGPGAHAHGRGKPHDRLCLVGGAGGGAL